MVSYDDDIRDLLVDGLFTREWTIVGTQPPSSDNAESGYFNMYYKQTYDDDNKRSRNAAREKPLTLKPSQPDPVELLPPVPSTLGPYYSYFRDCVLTGRHGEMLVNFCRNGKKSPCVDIPGCALVVPTKTADVENFTLIKLGNVPCVPVVPTSIILNIIDSLAEVCQPVYPSFHDGWAYNGSRVRMSKMYTECELDDNAWKKEGFARDFSRLVRCVAVATATFTVSVVLSPSVQRTRYPTHKKVLEVVIHNIK